MRYIIHTVIMTQIPPEASLNILGKENSVNFRHGNSSSVDNVLSIYEYESIRHLTDDWEHLQQRAMENMALADSFLGDKIHQEAYIAAAMYPLLNESTRIESLKYDSIITLIGDILPREEKGYVVGLCLDDSLIIETEKDLEIKEYPNKPNDWVDIYGPLASFDKIDNLIEETNLESVSIKAVSLLGDLKETAPADNETFEAINQAERLYAPICEIIGLDGLAMELRSRANILRLKHSGNYSLVEEAREILRQHGAPEDDSVSVLQFTEDTLRDIGIDNTGEYAVASSDEHETVVGHGYASLTEADSNRLYFRYVYRKKTAGSLAMKLYRQRKKNPDNLDPPMDLFGVTIIADDRAHIGKIARKISDSINESGDLTFKNSPSRTQSTVIRGGDDGYVDDIFEATGWDRSLTDHQKKPEGLEVTKVTFERNNVYIETQVLTEQERDRARKSPDIAHIIYKLEQQLNRKLKPQERERAGAIIENLHNQRFSMQRNELSASSRRRLFEWSTTNPSYPATMQTYGSEAMARAGLNKP